MSLTPVERESPEPALPSEMQRQAFVLVDAHVHIHECFSPGDLLDHAYRNFEQAARAHGWSAMPGVLMLTESAGVDRFGELVGLATVPASDPTPVLGAWEIELTPDPAALAAASGGRRLLLVAGRQVAAREGLEVLLLGTRATVPDGMPIREVLLEGGRLAALRVIPWGAGKWLFARGRLLRELMATAGTDEGLFLGDGAGRPFFWTKPRHFTEAERLGIRVLPGTDPLPFRSEVGRAGSYGFRLEGPVDLSRPAEGLKAALRSPTSKVTPFGRLERLAPFVRHQIAMQCLKRGRVGP